MSHANSDNECGTIYRQHLQAARARIQVLSRSEFTFSMVRLAVFFVGVALIISLYRGFRPPGWVLALPVGLFILLLFLHQRFMRAIRWQRLTEIFYESGLARLEDRWAGTGVSGGRHAHDHHPYAADLDLFGKGSLFERLCTAASHSGQETLAAWLLAPAEAAEARERQDAVRELASRLAEREEIFKILRDTPKIVNTFTLRQWSEGPSVVFDHWERVLAVILSATSFTALGGLLAGQGKLGYFVLAILVQGAFAYPLRRRIERATRFCDQNGYGLFSHVRFFGYIEKTCFESPRLRRLQEILLDGPRPASTELRRLDRLIGWLNDGRHNTAFIPFAWLMCWSLHFAVAIEHWRRVNGSRIAEWIRVLGEFEALSSLAAFAYENPGHAFPEISDGPPILEAEALGHPLLPTGRCVRNDVSLDRRLQLLIISGSNMSGKSTFLRTVGVNAVLALAGAPVRAARMRIAPLAVYALIRKSDSLQDGISRFYHEIKRIREIIDLSQKRQPLLFLIDEIFDGTNSHDRRVAAEAIMRTLTDRGALGLITSHDLALTEIATRLTAPAANAHFEDRIEGDRLEFDYRLREGAIQRGNALLLMRSIGLEV